MINILKENRKLRERCNTLENENAVLKNKMVFEFIDKMGHPEEIKRLKEKNKKNREKIKELEAKLYEKKNKRTWTRII